MLSNMGECHMSEAVLIYKFAISGGMVKGILTHSVNEFDPGEVDILFRVFLDDLRVVDGFQFDIPVT